MRNFIIFILVVVAVILVIFGVRKAKMNQDIVTEIPSETQESSGDMTQVSGSELYTIDTASSTVAWEAEKKVGNWKDTGTIAIQSGAFGFDESGMLVDGYAVIDMNSITVISTGMGKGKGIEGLQNDLRSSRFFAIDEFPTATLDITGASANGNQIMVDGQMTIRGVTRPISFPVTVSRQNGIMTGSAKLVIDRTQFGVEYGSETLFKDLAENVIVKDEFTLNITLVAKENS